MNTKIALLVFALSVEEEAKRKPFLMQGNLVNSLHAHTRAIATKSGLPVFYYDETKQIGDTFGQRFSNAIKNVFEQGYDQVIAVGNDCPNLKVHHIHSAKTALETGEAVLGPTRDGGFYLMGLSKEDFEYTTFQQLAWNTNTVFKDFSEHLTTRSIQCYILEKLWDINYFSSLYNLGFRGIQNVQLRNTILLLIKEQAVLYFVSKLKILQLLPSRHFNKGSPLSFSIYL